MNSSLSNKKPGSMIVREEMKLMLLIHEARNGRDNSYNPNAGINDGIFVPDPYYAQDLPDKVHYDGTTVVYLDGHARWGSYEELKRQRDEGYWLARDP